MTMIFTLRPAGQQGMLQVVGGHWKGPPGDADGLRALKVILAGCTV